MPRPINPVKKPSGQEVLKNSFNLLGIWLEHDANHQGLTKHQVYQIAQQKGITLCERSVERYISAMFGIEFLQLAGDEYSGAVYALPKDVAEDIAMIKQLH